MSRVNGVWAFACAVALGLPVPVAASAPADDGERSELERASESASAPASESPPATTGSGRAMAEGVRSDDAVFDEFDRHWNEGRRLFGRKEFARAAIEFERAYAAVPAADALYNVVVSYAEDGDAVSATMAAQRYIALPPCDDGSDPIRCGSRRDEVSAMLTDLRPRVVELALDISAGVTLREIRVNGRIVSAKRFPIFVEPGTVEIELVGSEPGQRVVREPKLRAGEQYIVRATPFRAVVEGKGAPTVPARVEPSPKPRNIKALKGTFFAGVGLTVLSSAALGTTLGLAVREDRRIAAKNACQQSEDGCDPDEHNPRTNIRRFDRYSLASTVLIGVTAGLAMATTIVGVFAFSKRRERSANQRASTRVRLRPSGAGLTLSF